MEIDGLGKRCALQHCRRLDYLPVRCAACGIDFCDEHKDASAHACTAAKPDATPGLCPQCGGNAGRGPDALARHLRTNCAARRYRADPLCSMSSCGKRDPLAVACPSCARTFCITHRHQEVHECAAAGTAAAAPTRRKRAALRPRTDFANARTTAEGDTRVPSEERVSVAVHFALPEAPRPRHMFFSERHSAGRVLDEIVKKVDGLQHPPPPHRLHMYAVRADSRGVNFLPAITPLRDLPVGTVSNGDSLVVHDSSDGLPDAFAKIATRGAPASVSSDNTSRKTRLFSMSRAARRRSTEHSDSTCSLV